MTVEFESRVPFKLATAARHFEDVERAAHVWFKEEGPFLAPSRRSAEDPNVLEIYAPSGYAPPVSRWEAGFVDGAHNLRAALDALAMELAHVDGMVPTEERDVTFPITPRKDSPDAQQAAWARVERSMPSISTSLIERLRALQTWSDPDTVTPDFLSVLSDIDNDDKHRFGVEVYTVPVLGPGVTVTPIAQGSGDELWAQPWVRFTLSPRPSGPPALVRLRDIVPFVTIRGRIGHLFDVQRALIADTDRYIAFILSGEWPPKPVIERLMPGIPVLEQAEIPNMRRVAAQRAWGHGLDGS